MVVVDGDPERRDNLLALERRILTSTTTQGKVASRAVLAACSNARAAGCFSGSRLHSARTLLTKLRGLDWHLNLSKTLPNSNRARVVALLHVTERAVCTGAVLESKNQFGVGKGG